MSQTPEQSSNTAIDATWLNWLPIIAGFLAIILISNYISTFYKFPINQNSAGLGAFGDYMGGLLNPLISLFTLIVAMKVWNLQKIELIETRRAVVEQGKTAEQQRREQRFFDLLNLYHETLKAFVIEGASGKAALSWEKLSPYDSVCKNFSLFGRPKLFEVPPNQSSFGILSESSEIHIKREVTESWNSFSPQLDHYFRTIFSILGELENLLKDDHIRYGKLFRDQLSRDELTLLAFHLLFDEEGKKMCHLVSKYGLLKHLAKNKLRDYALDQLDKKSFDLDEDKAQAVATLREETPC